MNQSTLNKMNQMHLWGMEATLKGIIADNGFSGMKDMGKVMGMATKTFAGKADNKTVSDIVKRLLAQ